MPGSREVTGAMSRADGAGPRSEGDGRTGLHHVVVQWVGRAIAAGRLADGALIQPEAIGEQLGVSRPVVRESLRVLQAKGMLEARPKTGTRVRSVRHWNLLDPDVISWRVHGPDRDRQLQELMDLRGAIEPSAARACCAHATATQIERLFEYCLRMEHATEAGDVDAFTVSDIRFHTELLAASGNLLYRQFATPVQAVLRARADLGLMPGRVDQVAVANHRAITQAVRSNELDRAEALTRQLVSTARGEIFAALAGH